VTQWPTQGDVQAFFGPPATSQVMLQTPYPLRLAWDPSTVVNRFQCHAKVVDAFRAVFQGALDHYGLERIQELRLDLFGGCFNHRPMRGGSALSMHSWGIAIDLDPERNQLSWNRSRAAFARPEYDPFWSIVRGQGLVSLGVERDFDWMHFQAARLTGGAATSGGNTGAAPLATREQIIEAQRRLGVTPDGIVGPRTRAATEAFQRDQGMQVTGVIGPLTLAALGITASTTTEN
jgi:peptidoglycan hydrolase-like protein with peptidoglycan-binding domain